MNGGDEPSLRGQYAGFATRAVAMLVDIVIILTVILVVTVSTTIILEFFNFRNMFYSGGANPRPTTLGQLIVASTTLVTSLAMYIGYPVLFIYTSGQTIGSRLMGLRIVSVDGSRVSAKRALIRTLCLWLSAFPFFLGYFWVLWDDQRRAWQDKIAGTCVVYYWDARLGPMMRARLAEKAKDRKPAQRGA